MINLCDINICTQCKACVQVCPQNCISMIDSKAGFNIPSIDVNKCIECHLCEKSCHQKIIQEKYEPKKVYAAWANNENVRARSSSGGAFSVFAENIILNKGIVFAAKYDCNLKLKHCAVDSIIELENFRGSKYIQSDINWTFKEIRTLLNCEKKILFVGTPCQVAALKAFLKHDFNNLLLVDLICHGVPSQTSFDNYLKKINIDAGKIENFKFRYCQGWGFQISYKQKSQKLKDEFRVPLKKTYYLKAFIRGLMFNEACYKCQYANPNRVSDITIGDFWDIGNTIPFDHPKHKGVSLILVNSEKGINFLENCKSNLFTEERTLDEALMGNHNLNFPSDRPKGRDTYFYDSLNLSIKELIKKYKLQPNMHDYLRPIKRFLLSFKN